MQVPAGVSKYSWQPLSPGARAGGSTCWARRQHIREPMGCWAGPAGHYLPPAAHPAPCGQDSEEWPRQPGATVELDPAVDTILPRASTRRLGAKRPSTRSWGGSHPAMNKKTLGLSCSPCPHCTFWKLSHGGQRCGGCICLPCQREAETAWSPCRRLGERTEEWSAVLEEGVQGKGRWTFHGDKKIII